MTISHEDAQRVIAGFLVAEAYQIQGLYMDEQVSPTSDRQVLEDLGVILTYLRTRMTVLKESGVEMTAPPGMDLREP